MHFANPVLPLVFPILISRYVPALYVMNKVDLLSTKELEIMHRDPNMVPICADQKWCLDALIERMWRRMDLIRVFTKPRGEIPDYAEPVILSAKRRTVYDFVGDFLVFILSVVYFIGYLICHRWMCVCGGGVKSDSGETA